MNYIFQQGWLDSLCGLYSLVNAEKIVNDSTDEESQILFNSLIEYLGRKRRLRETIVEGTNHKNMLMMLDHVIGDRIPLKIRNRKNVYRLRDWWTHAQDFLSFPNRSIILSLDGRAAHYTVVKSMTDKTMILADSGGIKNIRKNSCKLKGYDKDDKYIVFPSQCIYLGKL